MTTSRGFISASILTLSFISSLFALPSYGTEEASEGERCIHLARIDRTKVIDNRHILFYMKGGDVYSNELPHKCIGLRKGKTFMYKTSLNKLCNVDTITVLDDLGFGYSRGATCGLGKFQPVEMFEPEEETEETVE